MGLSEKKLGCIFSGKRDVSRVTLQEFNTVKPLNSRHLRVLKICLLLRGASYLEVILKRLSHLGLIDLSPIHDMHAIWDVGYWEVAL